VATATNETDEIRRRMAQIRHQLHEDVREVVAGTEAVTDWRRYVRMYPWATVGVVTAAGYMLVPRRRRSVPRDVARQSDVAEMREELERARVPEQEKERRASLVGAAFGMLAPMAWRVAQNYAMGYVEQWIAQQQQQYMAGAGPSHGGQPSQPQPQPPSGRPSGPRHS
jgi:hypothetical protein